MKNTILDDNIENGAQFWCIFQKSPLTNDLDEYIDKTKSVSKQIQSKLYKRLDESCYISNDYDNDVILERGYVRFSARSPRSGTMRRTGRGTSGSTYQNKSWRKRAWNATTRGARGAWNATTRGAKWAWSHSAEHLFKRPIATSAAAGIGGVGLAAYGITKKVEDYLSGKPPEIPAHQLDDNGQLKPQFFDLYNWAEKGTLVAAGTIKWDNLSWTDKLGIRLMASRKAGGWKIENMALFLAACYGLYKSRSYISSRIRELYNYITTGKCVAKCEFSANGNDYIARFNIGSKRWELVYKDIVIFSKSGVPSAEETNSFFKTQFFKKYASQCYDYMNKYLNDATFIELINAVNNDSNIDDDVKNAVLIFKDDRQTILNNIKSGKYQYI